MTIEEHSSMAITEQQNIAKSVEYEILKVEKLRALIFAIIIGSLAIVFAMASYLDVSAHNSLRNLPIVRLIMGFALAGFAGFELFIWYTISRCLHTGKNIHVKWHYIIAFVEISFPTMLILISSFALHVYALFLPPVFVYFLVIALSGLRLNFFICIVTHIFIGTVSYVVIYTITFVVISSVVTWLWKLYSRKE